MPCNADPKKCACTNRSCPRRGSCCACVAYHQKQGEIPGCLFSRAGEAKWDRSFAAFVADRQGR